MESDGGRSSQRSSYLRQCEIVTIRDRTLAAYVKYMSAALSQLQNVDKNSRVFNVILSDFSAPNVYAELVRCLLELPNLETLQILSYPAGQQRTIMEAFYNRSFPTVKTLAIPAGIPKILLCFLEVRTVIYRGAASWTGDLCVEPQLLRYMSSCTKVHELRLPSAVSAWSIKSKVLSSLMRDFGLTLWAI